MPQQFKAGAIIVDPSYKYILAVRGRISKKWGPPKGHLEEGEDLLETALREVHEEIGISFSFPDKAKILPRIMADRTRLFIIVLPLTVSFQTQDINEISEIAWIDMCDPPPQEDMTKLMKICLNRRSEFIRYARINRPNYDLDSIDYFKSNFNLNQKLHTNMRLYLSICHEQDVTNFERSNKYKVP